MNIARCELKKKLLVVASVAILTGVLFWWVYEPTSDTQVVYLLPEGLEGCVSIYFNQPDQQLLTISNQELLIEIPENGIVSTSSSYKVIHDLGWHKEKAFYVDVSGKRIRKVAYADFSNGGLYSNNSPLFERFSLSFDGRAGNCS